MSLLLADASGHVKFWHYTSGKCVHTIHEVRQVLTACSNPQGSLFLTAGADPEIHIYDEDTKKKIRTCKPRYSTSVLAHNGIVQLTFSPHEGISRPASRTYHCFAALENDVTLKFAFRSLHLEHPTTQVMLLGGILRRSEI